jgi:ATP-binding cassette subfamily B protein
MLDEENTPKLPLIKSLIENNRRLWKIVWQEKRGIVIRLIVLMSFLATAPFLVALTRGGLINELIRIIGAQTISREILIFLSLTITASLISPIFSTFQTYVLKDLWFYLDEKFQILLVKKKGEIDLAIHESPTYNDLFNRVKENSIWRLQNFVERQFYLTQNLIEVVIASFILGWQSLWILLVIVLGTIPELIAEIRYGHEIWTIWGAKSAIRRRFWDLERHFENIPDLTELKLFQNVDNFIARIRKLLTDFFTEQRHTERRNIRTRISASVIGQASIAITTVWLVMRVINGELSIGTLTFLFASVSEFRQSLSSLFRNLGNQYQDNLFVKDAFAIIDLPPALPQIAQPIKLPKNITPEITFENVSFRYPETERWALQNFTLTIHRGEKLALVGANGAGKTTIVKLLCRFYDPTEGKILVDGHDLTTIDLESWRYLIGALFQEYSSYNFAVKEAIGIGRTNTPLSMPRVYESAEASEAQDFIKEWDDGYEQILGKQFASGVEPSIGQWQKLALARTFYRDPKILILDEPTSSIDSEAEAKIFRKLEKLPKDRTVLLISHRFSTVRQADKICVVKDGRLAEYGSHQELLKKKGTYARLFSLQAKSYQ